MLVGTPRFGDISLEGRELVLRTVKAVKVYLKSYFNSEINFFLPLSEISVVYQSHGVDGPGLAFQLSTLLAVLKLNEYSFMKNLLHAHSFVTSVKTSLLSSSVPLCLFITLLWLNPRHGYVFVQRLFPSQAHAAHP